MKIAVIGSCNMDLVTYTDRIPSGGETFIARQFSTHFGGKGANQAVAAARLRADVAMVACVGDDGFGDEMVENFRRQGMAVDQVRRESAISSGVAAIWVDSDAENRILIVPGANERLAPEVVDAQAEWLQQVGLIVLQLEIPLATVYAAIDFGAAHGVPVLLNPAPARAGLDRARLASCRYLVPNETELALLTGLPTGDPGEVAAAAGSLVEAGVAHVIVTLGAAGALWVSSDGAQSFPAPAVTPIDSTGAGDAFIGCLSAGLAGGLDLPDAIRRAVHYAALSVTAQGAQSSYLSFEAFAARGG